MGYHSGTIFEKTGSVDSSPPEVISDSAATSITLESGSSITFQNVGSGIVWWGDATVNPTNSIGHYIVPGGVVTFKNVASTFTIYFKCPSGVSTTIGINQV